LIVADNRDGFWLRHADTGKVEVRSLKDGLSIVAAGEIDDLRTRRLELAAPKFRAAAPPDPDRDDWRDWQALLSDNESPQGESAESALRFRMPHGYGTVSSALIALPEPSAGERKPRFRYAQWQPSETPWADVSFAVPKAAR